jgi:tetratricopeptide (TPR) repeat protein
VNNGKLRAATAFVAALAALTFAGCGKKEVPGEQLKARADGLFAHGEYEKAARVYDALFVDYPEWAADAKTGEARDLAQAKALFAKARAAARANRFDEAGDILTEALSLAPNDAEINYGIGWIYIQTALEYQAKAQVTRGGAQADYGLLADAHAELARERFERSIELDGRHWAGYRGMAVYHLYKGENDEALASLADADKYSKTAEDKITVGRLRFRAYVAESKPEEGKKALDVLIEKYPEQGEAYFALGEYYLLLPKPDTAEAAKAFEVGVTKKFEDPGTRGQMYVMLSRLRIREGDYDGAWAAAKAALADDPFNGMFMDEYAVAWGAKKLAAKRK